VDDQEGIALGIAAHELRRRRIARVENEVDGLDPQDDEVVWAENPDRGRLRHGANVLDPRGRM
jgi:hypothetical protein